MSLGIQLHLSNESELEPMVRAVKNDEMTILRKKPAPGTGLWTSTWGEESRDSEWVECYRRLFGSPEDLCWFLLTPEPDARIYVIDSYHDLAGLIQCFPLAQERLSHPHFVGIDFERMSEAYDGLYLTLEGEARLHLSFPLDMNGWDCESCLWFRWCFRSVEKIEPRSIQIEMRAGA